MKKIFVVLVAALLVLGGAWLWWQKEHPSVPATLPVSTSPNKPPQPSFAEKSGVIRVDAPAIDASVSSPLTVTGKAVGTWYFEASFPVRLVDANGNEIARAPAQAQGDWMTSAMVPFTVTLQFSQPATPTGTLVLEKDNPSGLPEHADQIVVPVRFTSP